MPNPDTCPLEELEQAMECALTRRSHKRFIAIHLLLLNVPIETVLRNAFVSKRTLRLWIRLFNEGGIDALKARRIPGRTSKLGKQQFQEVVAPILSDPSTAGQRHWTAVKLHGYLKKHKGLDIGYSTLVRHMHENNYKRLFPRAMPQPRDEKEWKNSRTEFNERLKSLIDEDQSRIFFCDETGIEGDPRPRQRWATRGSSPEVKYYGGHLRRNIVGAVEPISGRFTSIIVSHCNKEVFQAFLNEFVKENPPGDRPIYLIMDNASWHKAKSLNWYHIRPLYLPPYSPDLNPIEKLWLHIKQNYLADFITSDSQELTEEIIKAIRKILKSSNITQSVCSAHKFKPKNQGK